MWWTNERTNRSDGVNKRMKINATERDAQCGNLHTIFFSWMKHPFRTANAIDIHTLRILFGKFTIALYLYWLTLSTLFHSFDFIREMVNIFFLYFFSSFQTCKPLTVFCCSVGGLNSEPISLYTRIVLSSSILCEHPTHELLRFRRNHTNLLSTTTPPPISIQKYWLFSFFLTLSHRINCTSNFG